ncbi:hypothetical protein H5397_08090 [Propioniciclava sp. MC1683]|uniref:hypothetical protein n=1 Tax=Propioniciclava sp. MC1683 TaxID=2760309 RepID=UPI0015FFF717|nr:hypothetical protein [Propioniciclava sp. MC1683]MBB1501385.1 hypothetical protein [Propioniciclava sp. MC1683]
MRRRDRIRHLANWLNLSTPVGLLVAGAGGARVRRRPDGIFVAEGYRFAFPVAGAFTIGDVVTTASTMDRLEARVPGVYAHEVRHAWQFAATGVWFLPAYLVASAWSLARTGSPALRNPLERHAGLVTGGYAHADGAPIGAIWMFRGSPGLTGVRLARPVRRPRRPTAGGPNGAAGGSRAGGGGA